MNANHTLNKDLEHILHYTLPLWENLRGKRLFITGGTGFIGCWLLESFIWANERLNLNATAVILSRNSTAFAQKCPHLFNNKALALIDGDVRCFSFPEGHFSHIIHAATEASVTLNKTDPLLMFDTITEGTKRTLAFATHCGAKEFLLLSSGAVYGKQPSDITHVSENYPCQPGNLKSAYAVGKYTAEYYADVYGKQHDINVKTARCFAFVGPYLPLDTHYAIGNFIKNGLDGKPILIQGDGTPFRSYLYAADLAIWLWHILFLGQPFKPYNVGSSEEITIAELAHLVANHFTPTSEVKITKPQTNSPAERYVPDTKYIKDELQLKQHINLNDAIHSTKEWHLTHE